MLNKKLKVLLSLLVAITLMSTMCFATDADTVEPEGDVQVTSEEVTTEGETLDLDSVEPATSEENDDIIVDDTAGVETKDGDIYQTGDKIDISDAINGNVFIVANELNVTGQIGGDLFVIAKTVNLEGAQIYGNIFAIADNLKLDGLTYDVYAMCNNLEIPYNGTTYRDVKVICQNATIEGLIGGNANIKASNSLTVKDECIIYKDLNYSAPNEIEVKEGVVTGEINYTQFVENVAPTKGVSDYILNLAITLVFTLVIWGLMLLIAPKFMEKIVTAGKTRIGASFGFGAIGLICTPIIALVLLISVIGVPVAIALIAVYALVLAISFTLATISIAHMLATKVPVLAKGKNVLAILVVAIVLWALKQIPVVGALVTLVIALYGMGMFILAILNKVGKKEKSVKTKEAKNE